MMRWLAFILLLSAMLAFAQLPFSEKDIAFLGERAGYLAENAVFNPSDASAQATTLSSTGPTGLADGKQFTFSVWLYRTLQGGTGGAEDYIFTLGNPTGPAFKFVQYIDANDKVTVICANSAGSIALNMASTNTVSSGVWTHIYTCADVTDATKTKIYINGVIDQTNAATRVDLTIDYVGTTWSYVVARYLDNQGWYGGGISEFWWNDSYLDDPTKFRSANGCPVNLGADGSLPTGSAPVFYFKGSGNQITNNFGTGGNFQLLNGPLTTTNRQCNL